MPACTTESEITRSECGHGTSYWSRCSSLRSSHSNKNKSGERNKQDNEARICYATCLSCEQMSSREPGFAFDYHYCPAPCFLTSWVNVKWCAVVLKRPVCDVTQTHGMFQSLSGEYAGELSLPMLHWNACPLSCMRGHDDRFNPPPVPPRKSMDSLGPTSPSVLLEI